MTLSLVLPRLASSSVVTSPLPTKEGGVLIHRGIKPVKSYDKLYEEDIKILVKLKIYRQ